MSHSPWLFIFNSFARGHDITILSLLFAFPRLTEVTSESKSEVRNELVVKGVSEGVSEPVTTAILESEIKCLLYPSVLEPRFVGVKILV
jgi:hypothetical protein